MDNQFALLTARRFGPFFVTQALGALNDNLLKSCVSVLLAYGIWNMGSMRPDILVSLAAGVFILPFILFTPLAGSLADKYDKARLMRILKLSEIVIVLGAIATLWLQSVVLSFVMIFCLGAQSAFFSPAKFALLPQHLSARELVGGNALANTGTFLAILAGTILGSLLALSDVGVFVICGILLCCAAIGYFASRFIPEAPPPAPNIKLVLNSFKSGTRLLRYVYDLPDALLRAMIGIGWFYFVGALMIAQFPNFTSQVLGADQVVLTMFMVIFSVGIGLGGLLNNRLLKSKIDARLVPFSLIAMIVFSADLYFASGVYAQFVHLDQIFLMSPAAFLSDIYGWRIVLDLLALSIAGGLYVVPLQCIVQHRAPKGYVARVQAASGLINAVFVLLSSAAALGVLGAGYRVQYLFWLVAFGSILALLGLRPLYSKSKSNMTGT